MLDQKIFLIFSLCMAGLFGFMYFRLKSEFKEQRNKILELNQALLQSSKMSVLGEMAGQVAHELNTPISIVQLLTEQLVGLVKKEEEPVDREKWQKALLKIDLTMKRITDSVSTLRAFVRDSREVEPVEYLVSSIVQHAISLSKEKFKYKSIEIEYLQESETLVICKPAEITQALLYLLINSEQAIESSEKKHIKIELKNLENEIELSVTDSRLDGVATSGTNLDIVALLVQSYQGRMVGGAEANCIVLRLGKFKSEINLLKTG
jgi:C4-dicarboxylate-specific signal transduction histidine kinase